jgi:biopolymer transport protein TolR
LGARLQAIFENKKNRQVFIEADSRVDYGFVAQVMSEIRNAGIYQIGLITQPVSAKNTQKTSE